MNMENKKIRLLASFLITIGLVFIAYLFNLFVAFLINFIGVLAFPIFILSVFFVWLIIEIYNYLNK